MKDINIKMLVPIEQLIEDVESVIEIVERYGSVIILQNNKPTYVLNKCSDVSKMDEDFGEITATYKLHEAMQIVLKEQSGYMMHAADLANEIFKRKLYLKRDGTMAKSNQIRARSENYSNLFEVLTDNMIKLR